MNALTIAAIKPDGLTQKQETFAQRYVERGNASEAYTDAYDVAPSTSRHSINANAWKVLNHPKVAARVRELQAAAGERALMSTADLIADLEHMANADVNEVMTLTVGACRWCHGDGAYRWRDEAELGRAVDRYMRSLGGPKPLPPPDTTGTFGYSAERDPDPECDQCSGAGITRVRFANTAELSPGARKLYRGVELYGDGTVKKVLLSDPLAARMELHRLRGMVTDRSQVLIAKVDVPYPKDMTPEQQADFIRSLGPPA